MIEVILLQHLKLYEMKKIIFGLAFLFLLTFTFSFKPIGKSITKIEVCKTFVDPLEVGQYLSSYLDDYEASSSTGEQDDRYMDTYSPSGRAGLCSTILTWDPGSTMCRIFYVIYNCSTGEVLWYVQILS